MRALVGASLLMLVCGLSACGSSGDEALPPGTIDAFCREASVSPFGTVHDEFDPEPWGQAIEDMHIAAPTDLREETQALVDLAELTQDPRSGPISTEAFNTMAGQLPELCGLDVNAAFDGDYAETSRLYDTIEPFLAEEGTSYGDTLGHVFVSIPGLSEEDAPAVCDAVVGFRSDLEHADSISIIVASADDAAGTSEVLASTAPGGDCTS